jgi:hypothetical protein
MSTPTRLNRNVLGDVPGAPRANRHNPSNDVNLDIFPDRSPSLIREDATGIYQDVGQNSPSDSESHQLPISRQLFQDANDLIEEGDVVDVDVDVNVDVGYDSE